MSISYKKVSKHPVIFLRLFGIKPEEFRSLHAKVESGWHEKVIMSYKRPGRDYKLSLSEMLLMLLLYYRSYITQMQVGFMFGLDDSRVCRIIRQLEPIVAKIIAIEKNRALKLEDIALLLDVTEQPIERPKKDQKAYYSGKKKRHTIKTEIRVNPDGKIRSVSKAYGGKMHDFNIHKASDPLPENTKVYADSGYQGLRKRHKGAKTPFKRTRKKPLTKRKVEYNRAISSRRIKVENVIGQLKTFRILSERYRNKRKRHNLKFNIVAGLVNLKNGFSDIS